MSQPRAHRKDPPLRPAQTPEQVLRDVFGYQAFRGQQQAIIEQVLGGSDALVLMPTGGGKSLCYQIPALLRPGTGVVVSPLIALMADQVNALTELGVRAAFLNSSLEPSEQQRVTESLRDGQLDMLYVAPERLMQPRTLAMLQEVRLSLIAIDEAHCVSQWGHDFRPEYLMLSALADAFPSVPRLALTATATEPTRKEIIERLALHEPQAFVAGFDRPNIRYQVQAKRNPRTQLAQFLSGREAQSGIVYCLTRKRVEQTAQWLQQQGFNALPYHAGLSAELRAEHQHRFVMEESIVMVATIAFGMGIDKPDVRFVAHLDLPKSMESYYQETGRAGRDGEPADAWMVYGLGDVVQLRQLADQSQGNDQYKRLEREKLDALLGWCEVTECRRIPLLRYFGDDPSEPCGNCDNCLTPPQTWDGSEAARKLLSAVYRTGQRFGAAHVVDVLTGSENEKVLRNQHDQLSVYAIGKDLSKVEWRSIVRQLVVKRILRADPDRYGALVLTEGSRAVLRGEIDLALRRDIAVSKSQSVSSAAQHAQIGPEDQGLWEALRACRKELAEQLDLPPYVIFHDSTLRQMVQDRPQNEDQLLAISGVGPSKLARYGAAFLAVLHEHSQEA